MATWEQQVLVTEKYLHGLFRSKIREKDILRSFVCNMVIPLALVLRCNDGLNDSWVQLWQFLLGVDEILSYEKSCTVYNSFWRNKFRNLTTVQTVRKARMREGKYLPLPRCALDKQRSVSHQPSLERQWDCTIGLLFKAHEIRFTKAVVHNRNHALNTFFYSVESLFDGPKSNFCVMLSVF